MNLAELDDFAALAGLLVRSETLAEVWEMTAATALGGIPPGQVLALITVRVRPGGERRFEQTVQDFIAAASNLSGALSSTLHRSPLEPSTGFCWSGSPTRRLSAVTWPARISGCSKRLGGRCWPNR